MGKRYICPVCEKELKGSRKFCPHCRSLIREPMVYTGDYLPNESECYRSDVDYMDPRNLKKQQAHVTEHKKNLPDRPEFTIERPETAAGGRTAASRTSSRTGMRTYPGTSTGSGRYTYGGQPSKSKQKGEVKLSGIVIFLIFLFISFLGNC